MRASTRERLDLAKAKGWARGEHKLTPKVEKEEGDFPLYLLPMFKPCPCGGNHQARHHHYRLTK